MADAIVQLVGRTDGPVTLARVEREISGFAKKDPPSWSQVLVDERFIWNGMTEAGCAALGQVIYGLRDAIQPVNVLPYLVEDYIITDEHWWPIVLLPAKAANLQTPNFLVRVSPECREHSLAYGEKAKFLTPAPLQFTADQFSV
jgi:hypothetical protein